MAEFNKAMGYDWTPEEQAQQTRLAKQLNALDFVENYPQDESSRLIQDSSIGYALCAELKAQHHTQVQMLAEYGQERVSLELRAWRETPYDRNDPWAAPCEMLIVAGDSSRIYPLDERADVVIAVREAQRCEVAISDQCRDRNDYELYMKHGQVLAFWQLCERCHSWLLGMARVEKESDADPDRKAKHFREVVTMYGNATRDLTPFMRGR